MRSEPNKLIEHYRHQAAGFESPRGVNWGAFAILYRGRYLHVISSGTPDDPAAPGYGWEHVSVSTNDRCPTWEEMQYIKTLFWRGDETVIQYHPPADRSKNLHPFTLHMWRPTAADLPLPPLDLV